MPLWAQITLTSATLFNVACAWLVWRLASASSRTTKRLRDLEQTTADLELSFDSLLESHKKLRSRAGMRELRAREDALAVETKAQVRARLFGSAAGPAFAKIQQSLNADR
jgi:hypothetical protein